ncbi:MAG: leucine-rich repeat-containing protein kinase family protein [Methylocystis sp.]|uniref:leucine-rich repeat-containing protein kinase family protein n=1 Tax=Methylocystis sp. TaxID=1911079 RepID=UPI003DA27F84
MPPDSTLSTLDALRRGDLAGARELRLPGLSEFPREIFGLAETLELLDLGNGALTALPEDMGRLRKLRVLFCSNNRFTRLPPSLGDCAALGLIGFRKTGMREVPGEALPPALRWLTLTDNEIAHLPNALGRRPHLQKLMLAGNRLTTLPDGLAQAGSLELIRLSANRLERLPVWLRTLPSLAWISWSANPCAAEPAPAQTRRALWPQLEIGGLLGEGASGRVHRAEWRMEGGVDAQPVALKLFKGAMTSDGLPAHEMAACLAAGAHPNLTSAIGRLAGHPDGAEALLLPLLPAHWRPLAEPPSLESCSRDVYDPRLRLGAGAARRLLRGIAGAVAHLHARDLLHGDLYAHNILWDGDAGEAILSDFGAASALAPGDDNADWRRIETRAFGLLMMEALDRCAEAAQLAGLRELARVCVQPDTRARPLMADVLRAI